MQTKLRGTMLHDPLITRLAAIIPPERDLSFEGIHLAASKGTLASKLSPTTMSV
jgi:hypothetical protein